MWAKNYVTGLSTICIGSMKLEGNSPNRRNGKRAVAAREVKGGAQMGGKRVKMTGEEQEKRSSDGASSFGRLLGDWHHATC
jgi:hypothetical protein